MKLFVAVAGALLFSGFGAWGQIPAEPTSAEDYYRRAARKIDDADKFLLDVEKWARMRAEALRDFDKALELDPDNRKYLIERGRATEDPAKAIADLSRAIEMKPDDPEPYTFRALLHGDFERGIADFDKAVSLDPKNPRWHDERGEFLNLNNDPKAIADYNRALSLDPKYLPALRHRASYYFSQNAHLKAIADWTTHIRIAPDPIAYLSRAESYEKMRSWAKAIEDVTAAINLMPSRPGPLLRRAEIYRRIGRKALAEKDEKTAARVQNSK